ncbi:hypothetical protein KKF84_15665, partial [Myxococcota bacterium]|nr:hypothetical protein [Myxococcota bacterium]
MRAFFLTTTAVLFLFGGTACKKSKKAKEETPQPPEKVMPVAPRLAFSPLWEKEMLGFAVVGDSSPDTVYAITFAGKRQHVRARKQSTFEAVSGVMRWQKKRSLSTFRFGLPWTTQFALRSDA